MTPLLLGIYPGLNGSITMKKKVVYSTGAGSMELGLSEIESEVQYRG